MTAGGLMEAVLYSLSPGFIGDLDNRHQTTAGSIELLA